MNARRFKATPAPQRIKYAGVITVDDLRKKFNIPTQADVFVRVPGGADWSNTDLEIDNDKGAIQVTWEEIK